MKKIQYTVIALALFLFSCKGEVKQTEEETHDTTEENVVELTEQQMHTIGIKVGSIEKRQLAGTISATGTLKLSPQDRAEVTSLVAGVTKRILVKEGQVVHAGQTLALVENTEIMTLQKDYLIATRQLSLAKQTWQRQQNLRAEGAGIEKNLEQAKAELDMASVTERGLRLQMEQLGISSQQVAQGHFTNTVPVNSPINGVVGEILISTGSYLDSEIVIMRVYNNRALHADINVFERDISRINLGQKVTLQLSDEAATHLTGKVSFITAAIDNDSKSASVHISLDPAEGVTLLPNMFVSAVIHCNEQTCNAVPDEAIVMNANRNYVFVSLGDNRFRKEEVVTGLSQQGYTEITFPNGTDPSAKIVVDKAFYLQSMLSDHGEEE